MVLNYLIFMSLFSSSKSLRLPLISIIKYEFNVKEQQKIDKRFQQINN